MCIDIFNKLPDSFKVMKEHQFNKSIKSWLLDKCCYSLKDFMEHNK